MNGEVALWRLYLLRVMYLMNFVMLGASVWPAMVRHEGNWDPMQGVAFSFWAALSLLSGFGLRHPLKMLPVLLMQFTYKSIWCLAVALPTWPAVKGTELATAMFVGVVLDLIVIPWRFLYENLRARGERWR